MKKSLFILSALCTLLLYSCNKYPDAEARTEEQDVTVTEFDKDIDFGGYNTYAVVDSIILVKDTIGQDTPLVKRLDPDLEKLIRETIIKQMDSRGYTRVEPDSTPDITINSTVSIVQNVNIYRYYWYPWYGGGWGWGYPGYWYPPYYSYSVDAYQTGSVFLFMEDNLRDPIIEEGEELIPISWRGVVNGLVTSSTEYDASRVEAGITQCFTQSPYIQK